MKKERYYSERRGSLKDTNWTKSVLERDDYKCRRCGSKEKLVAHHIVPWKESIELRFDANNGETLCRSCHMKHHYENAKKRFTKGITPWNKGLKGVSGGTKKGTKFTEEHKAKLSKAKIGKSSWNKGLKGKNSHMTGKIMTHKGKAWVIDKETGKRKWV